MAGDAQAANSALAAISANLHPGTWTKSEHTEENLRSFNQWFERYERWTNVCLRGVNLDDSMKWDVLIAAAGSDLHDIMKEACIETSKRIAQNEIPHRDAQEEVPAGPNNDPPYQEFMPEQPFVPAVTPITPTVYAVGIEMIRNTITKFGNDISQRCMLMTGMPASKYDDWRTWGLRLKEQSKRCKWGKDYTWEVAALDALLYQCPDDHWKTKILGNPQWSFQEALDYGIRMYTAKKQGQDLTMTTKAEKRVEAVDRVKEEEAKTYDCKWCKGNHTKGSCPAYNTKCQMCGRKGHYAKSEVCRANKKPNPPPQQSGAGQGRNQRGRGRGQGGARKDRGTGTGAPPQTSTKTVFRKEHGAWKKKRQTVNCVEVDASDSGEDEDEEDVWDYNCDRLEVNMARIGPKEEPTTVKITPTSDAKYRTKVEWTTDTGVRKTLLSEKHFLRIKDHNPQVKLKQTKVQFRPFSTKKIVPLHGKMEARLTNNHVKQVITTVYVTKDSEESLLGREDAIALGVIKVFPDGDKPDGEKPAPEREPRARSTGTPRSRSRSPEPTRCITPERLNDPIVEGIVSGGQTQDEIDAMMDQIVEENSEVFKGMGRAKVDPINIQVKEGAKPITQGKRPIPIQLREATLKKLGELKANDLIEGPLPARECKGCVTNMVVTKK